MDIFIPQGYFKIYAPLKGRDWIKRLPPEELQAFVHIGLAYADYGRLGGNVRAKTGKRDSKGRFIKEKL